jgi:uncharacterized protein (DUF4415 family)
MGNKSLEDSQNKDIVYGDIEADLSLEEMLDPKNLKISVTAFIDGDVYDALKVLTPTGERYQSMLNTILRKVLIDKIPPLESKNGNEISALDKQGERLRQAEELLRDVKSIVRTAQHDNEADAIDAFLKPEMKG